MKRAAVYSSTRPSRASQQVAPPAAPRLTWAQWRARYARRLKIAGGVALAALAAVLVWTLAPERGMTMADVESAVKKALEAQQPALSAADAYESILPSVVHVRGLPDAPDADVPSERE